MGDSKAFAAAYKMAGNAASDEVIKMRAEIARLRALGLEACDLAASYADDAREYGAPSSRIDEIRKELIR